MSSPQTHFPIDMQPGGVVQFTARGRQRLLMRGGDGYVWLTRDGDIKDYWLGAGDAITLCPGDHVWLTLEEASRPASLALESLSPPAPRWRGLAALLPGHHARPCRPEPGHAPG